MKKLFFIKRYIYIIFEKLDSIKLSAIFKNKIISELLNDYPYSRIIFLILFIPFNQFPQSNFIEKGTTIISVVRNDTIWIGADSKVTNESGEFVGTTCKIIRFKDMIFAHAGLLEDKITKFNVEDLFIYSYAKGQTVLNIIEIFEDTLLSKLGEASRNFVPKEQYTWGDTLKSHTLETIIAYVTDSTTNLVVNRYFAKVIDPTGKAVSFNLNPTHIIGKNNQVSVMLSGYYGQILNKTSLFKTGDVPSVIDSLIKIECVYDSLYVGKPVDIIRLTKDGINWIQNSKLCP